MRIAVVGFGIEGKSATAYFLRKGHQVVVHDQNAELAFPAGCGKKLGADYLRGFESYDLVIRSPGISAQLSEFAGLGKKLSSVTKYFFHHCPARIIGITGTKGKGTTTALIHEIFMNTHAHDPSRRVYMGGNFGSSPLDFLDELTTGDLVILELSSFQLMDLGKSPHGAVVLGITPDHLDYHADFSEYVSAKQNIVRFQSADDFAVIDIDNDISGDFAEQCQARVFEVSSKKTLRRGAGVKLDTFYIFDGDTVLEFGSRASLQLIGDHNVKNVLAAAAAAYAAGAPLAAIREGVENFRGLPHRLEFVRDIKGVRYYNDSASTNPETAIAAIRSFQQPMVLVLGGASKNLDYENLADEIIRNHLVHSVVLMGETRDNIEVAIHAASKKYRHEWLKNAEQGKKIPPSREQPLQIIPSDSYQEAFMVARMLAQPDDVVLFSPACASFDMFANYKERGEIFRNFVLEA